ncbi:MAG: hypothetical protein JNM68_10245 [Dinghuibacter sp.]|nr:hypothetical protein [Dinghuibacter sp.]
MPAPVIPMQLSAGKYLQQSENNLWWAGYITAIGILKLQVGADALNLQLQALQLGTSWGNMWE